MKPIDMNTTEAGPVTASDDIYPSDLHQLESGVKGTNIDDDITNKCKVDQFDPLQDVTTTDITNDSFLRNLGKENEERQADTDISTHNYDGLLIPVTPLHPISRDTPRTHRTLDSTQTLSTPHSQSSLLSNDMAKSPYQLMAEREAKHKIEVNKLKTIKEEMQKKVEASRDRLNLARAKAQPTRDRLQQKMAALEQLRKTRDELNLTLETNSKKLDQYEETLENNVNECEKRKCVIKERIRKKLADKQKELKHAHGIDSAYNDVSMKYKDIVSQINDRKASIVKQTEKLKGKETEIETAAKQYNECLAHLTAKIQEANRERDEMQRKHKVEMEKKNQMIKQLEITTKSNEEKINRQDKQKTDLTQIHTDLLRRLN